MLKKSDTLIFNENYVNILNICFVSAQISDPILLNFIKIEIAKENENRIFGQYISQFFATVKNKKFD